MKGQSTSSEVDPEYFGAKRRSSFQNENIRCDTGPKVLKLFTTVIDEGW
jgi:hypothetical protein